MIRGVAPLPKKAYLGLLLLVGLMGTPAAGRASIGTTGDPLYKGLESVDVALARAAVQETLETTLSRRTRVWINEATGHSGSIRPVRTFRISDGRYCREYREFVTSRHGRETATRVACRDRDGVWRPVGR